MTTKIEWCKGDDGKPGKSWNPVVGCTKIGKGCLNCYAEKMSRRLAGMAKADIKAGRNPGKKIHYCDVVGPNGKWNGNIKLVPEASKDPLGWRKPCNIFVCSMSDLFHADVPDEFLDQVFAGISLCPQHQFIILTKRPENCVKYLLDDPVRRGYRIFKAGEMLGTYPLITRPLIGKLEQMPPWPFANLLLGFSASTQKEFDEGWGHMAPLAAAGWKVIVSLEPLLEPIDILKAIGLALIIVGGESGPGARPCNIEHVRSIVRQCKAAKVKIFVKQLGSNPVDDDDCWKDCPQYPECYAIAKECSAEQKKQSITENIKHPKGGDPAEWPKDLKDLRVRQWPKLEN